jgi:ATP-dependent DNA ligase
MLATLTDRPIDDAAWVFEDKYDGFRMVAITEHRKVKSPFSAKVKDEAVTT